MINFDEMLNSAQYVVDRQGKQTAVLLDLSTWRQVRHLLEELAEDERLGQLMDEVAADEKLEGEDAYEVYQEYLADSER